MDKNMDFGAFDEEDFASLLDASLEKVSNTEEIIDGTVVDIKDDFAVIDIGQKSEGRIPLSEISGSDGAPLFGVGDTIPVLLIGYKYERPMISYSKAMKRRQFEEFAAAHQELSDDMTVEGTVRRSNKGGYVVEGDNGMDYFLPRSLAGFAENDKELVGKKIKAVIVKIDRDNGTVVLSRKKLLDADRRKKRQIVKELIDDAKCVEGEIKKITSYGMFVDVGGMEGLVHYSEISYKGPVNPAQLYQVGEKVTVKAIEYNKEKKRLSLSIKATMDDPWQEIKEELEVGDTIKVIVSNIESYGAFVDLGNDIEGFLHISEISWQKNLKHPKEILTVGEEIDVEVIELDAVARKLRVSLKHLTLKPFDEFVKNYKVGDTVQGTVTSITDFGAFVKIGAIEALLHNEDTSWNRADKASTLFSVGDTVEARIIKIDPEKEKVSLSRKVLTESPIEIFAKTYKNGDTVTGTVRDKKEFGVFVRLADGVDAMVRIKDFTPEALEKINAGDPFTGKLVMIDKEQGKIRMVPLAETSDEMTEYSDEGEGEMSALGSLLKDKLAKGQ